MADDIGLWSGTFDGQVAELGGIQDTIVRAITGRLHLTTVAAPAESARSARGTNNIDAYYLYLQGRHSADRLEWDRASELYRQAIALDPSFARAYGALAISYPNETTLGRVSVDSMNRLTRMTTARALALDSTNVEAYVGEGNALLNEWRVAEAGRAYQKALGMDSTNVDALWAYAGVLFGLGSIDEGLAYVRRARDRDPLSSNLVGYVGYGLVLQRQYAEAIAADKLAIELDPRNLIAQQALGIVFALNGMPDSAVHAFEHAFALDSTIFGGRSNLVLGYAAAGRWKDALHQRALLERERTANSPNYHPMIAHLALGEYDAAMTSLERGVAAHEPLFSLLSIPCDPLFDPLQPNPRFAAVLKSIGARACPVTTKWPIPARPPS